jgi:hypothetical protein
MPVSKLYVEGDGRDPIDLSILQALLGGRPLVVPGGSKGSLKPRARNAREENPGVLACYLRDRDFDFDPPLDRSTPVIDSLVSGNNGLVLGWHWCRHEIESYLIDPRLVAAASTIPEATIVDALRAAASEIQAYVAARWAVGVARRDMPSSGALATRPTAFVGHEFRTMTVKYDEHQLPDWVRDSVLRYRDATNAALADDVIREHLKHYLRQLCLAIDGSIEDVLAWFSGKDLMTALTPAAYRSIAPGPKELRQKLRNWVRNNPDHAISLFPEWHALRERLPR